MKGPRPDLAQITALVELVDGKLIWKARNPDPSGFNKRCAGKPVALYLHPNGYFHVTVKRYWFKAHRVIWALTNGRWPVMIDHINGDRTDNRIENLREVDAGENCRNAALRKDNKTGVTGVNRSSRSDKWAASIRVDGRQIHIGHFTNFEEAVAARREAERRHGFSERHGRPISESVA